MTLTGNFSDSFEKTSCAHDESSNWNALYCTHLWSNSNLRQAVLNPACNNTKLTKYCYTCRGKIRNYGITPPKENFVPIKYSTPKTDCLQTRSDEESSVYHQCSNNAKSNLSNRTASVTDISIDNADISQYIPTISRQIDTSIRHKYTSSQYDLHITEGSQRSLSKSLKGLEYIVNWSLTKSPRKRRTKIQACSISVMIIAIILISLVLVNLTTINFKYIVKNDTSTSLVPTGNINLNENSSAVVNYYTDLMIPNTTEITTIIVTDSTSTTTTPLLSITRNNSLISSVILKIRKNIKTYPKDEYKRQGSIDPQDIVNKDLSQRFCTCQTNEVCMLDETSGTSVCRNATDISDPTGCGGLCAMDTEACQLVDKLRGVRVCKLLTQVTCSAQDWRCRNGFCVSSEARCDGHIQCYDRSDEMHCECDLKKQFRCGQSISCFPNKKKCDGFIDCWDGFDELNCTMECPENQFTCTNGQCIISSRFCDGLADCVDKSDEPLGCDGACGTHEIQCKNSRCVPFGASCDGQDDCGDGTDEMQCS